MSNNNEAAPPVNHAEGDALSLETFQRLLAVSNRCFELCVEKPGFQLSRPQRACLSKCVAFEIDAINTTMVVAADTLQADMEKQLGLAE